MPKWNSRTAMGGTTYTPKPQFAPSTVFGSPPNHPAGPAGGRMPGAAIPPEMMAGTASGPAAYGGAYGGVNGGNSPIGSPAGHPAGISGGRMSGSGFYGGGNGVLQGQPQFGGMAGGQQSFPSQGGFSGQMPSFPSQGGFSGQPSGTTGHPADIGGGRMSGSASQTQFGGTAGNAGISGNIGGNLPAPAAPVQGGAGAVPMAGSTSGNMPMPSTNIAPNQNQMGHAAQLKEYFDKFTDQQGIPGGPSGLGVGGTTSGVSAPPVNSSDQMGQAMPTRIDPGGGIMNDYVGPWRGGIDLHTGLRPQRPSGATPPSRWILGNDGERKLAPQRPPGAGRPGNTTFRDSSQFPAAQPSQPAQSPAQPETNDFQRAASNQSNQRPSLFSGPSGPVQGPSPTSSVYQPRKSRRFSGESSAPEGDSAPATQQMPSQTPQGRLTGYMGPGSVERNAQITGQQQLNDERLRMPASPEQPSAGGEDVAQRDRVVGEPHWSRVPGFFRPDIPAYQQRRAAMNQTPDGQVGLDGSGRAAPGIPSGGSPVGGAIAPPPPGFPTAGMIPVASSIRADRPVYDRSLTQQMVNQAVAKQRQLGHVQTALKKGMGRGFSTDEGTMSQYGVPAIAASRAMANNLMGQIPMDAAFANRNYQLGGEVARGNEALQLAGLVRGLHNTNNQESIEQERLRNIELTNFLGPLMNPLFQQLLSGVA